MNAWGLLLSSDGDTVHLVTTHLGLPQCQNQCGDVECKKCYPFGAETEEEDEVISFDDLCAKGLEQKVVNKTATVVRGIVYEKKRNNWVSSLLCHLVLLHKFVADLSLIFIVQRISFFYAGTRRHIGPYDTYEKAVMASETARKMLPVNAKVSEEVAKKNVLAAREAALAQIELKYGGK
jgi:hypothetical protein